jgi:hypothetical protein
MQWNYRVVRFVDPYQRETFRIHEVYYQDDKVTTVSEVPASPSGEDVLDLEVDLRRMLEALDKPVLNYDEL